MTTRMPVGTIRIRTRHGRGGEKRAWIKVADPNSWELLARRRWQERHGPIPEGMGIHHKDENTLNDDIDNLELTTKRQHLEIHRHAFHEERMASFTKTRRRLRWSTKSATKRTGRPPKYAQDSLDKALDAIRNGMSPRAAGVQFGVSFTTLYRRAKGSR